MKTPVRINQYGVAHLGLVVLIVVVLGGIGFAGWKVMSKNKDAGAKTSAVSKEALEAACTESDQNICTFMSSWKANKYYTVTSKTTTDGSTTETTYTADGDKKFHMVARGDTPYEMIVIDTATYTKAANGTWWKQTTKPEETAKYTDNFKYDDPKESETSGSEVKTTYKNLGSETCGSLTCHKYQVVNSNQPEDKEYIWFDTKDFQLRKTRSETKDGTVSESSFS